MTIKKEILKHELRYAEKNAALLKSLAFIMDSLNIALDDNNIKSHLLDFDKYLSPHNISIENHFCGMHLINGISLVESFLVDITREIIKLYPAKVGKAVFPLSDLLFKSKDEIINKAADEFINKIMYKKPSEYIIELGSLLSINLQDLTNDWYIYIEAKARRDLGVHNSWQQNDIYRRKIEEIGFKDDLTDKKPTFIYICDTLETCNKLVHGISLKLKEKYS